MAVSFDAASNAEGDGVSSVTFSHTCTGSNLGLGVGIAVGNNVTVSGVTYNGVAMTQEVVIEWDGPPSIRNYLFSLAAPASGANNVVVTGSGNADDFMCGAVSATNVDQADPVSNATSATGTSSTPSVSVTSANGELAMDMLGYGSPHDATAGAGQTERWDMVAEATQHGAGSTEASSGSSVTMSWTLGGSVMWATVAMSFKEVAGAAAATPYNLLLLGVG